MMMIGTMPRQRYILIRQNARSLGPYIDHAALIVRQHLGKNTAHLQSRTEHCCADRLCIDRLLQPIRTALSPGHAGFEGLQHIEQVFESWGDEQLRLWFGDIIRLMHGVDGVRDLPYLWPHAPLAFADGRQESGTEYLRVLYRPDQSVFDGPPLQSAEQGHLRGGAHVGLQEGHAFFCLGEGLWVGVGELLQDRQGPNGLIQCLVLTGENGAGAYLAEATQVSVVGRIADDGRMSGGFMDDVRC